MKKILFDILYYLQILRLFPAFYFHYELRKYIKKGDVVIDIGANWGIYTRLFSRWVKDGVVFAVEPIDKFVHKLAKMKRCNVNVIPHCLGDWQGDVYMSQWRDSDGAYKVDGLVDYNSPAIIIGKEIRIAYMAKGSELFKYTNKIDFIKIDVEMTELHIIQDMQELIKKHKPMILVETGFIEKILEILDYKIKDKCLNDYLIEAKTKNS